MSMMMVRNDGLTKSKQQEPSCHSSSYTAGRPVGKNKTANLFSFHELTTLGSSFSVARGPFHVVVCACSPSPLRYIQCRTRSNLGEILFRIAVQRQPWSVHDPSPKARRRTVRLPGRQQQRGRITGPFFSSHLVHSRLWASGAARSCDTIRISCL
jgi:hypothetical protein